MMSFPEVGAYHGIAFTSELGNIERRRLRAKAFISNVDRSTEDGTGGEFG